MQREKKTCETSIIIYQRERERESFGREYLFRGEDFPNEDEKKIGGTNFLEKFSRGKIAGARILSRIGRVVAKPER